MGEEPLLPFKTGLFHLATQRPDVDLVPVWIENLNQVMPKGEYLPDSFDMHGALWGSPADELKAGEDKDAFPGTAAMQRCLP